MGGVLPDLADFLQVVVRHQRLVLVQFLERLDGLDRVGVDDLVPDVILPLLGGHVLDVLVNDSNSGMDATSKLAPALYSVRTISGAGFAFTA